MDDKYYVVFVGRKTGIYDNWRDCESQVNGFKNAIFKSFYGKKNAEKQFDLFNRSKNHKGSALLKYPKPTNGVCTDATFSYRTLLLEYRVVDIKTNTILFSNKIEKFTNKNINVGEFFALVRAVKYVIDNKVELPIYSDSVTAIKWFTEKSIGNVVVTDEIREKLERGLEYLKNVTFPVTVVKWQTDLWNQIPADYKRK